MNQENTLTKILKGSIILLLVAIFIECFYYIIGKARIQMTHLGSGNFKASSSEEIVFEYMRNEPFTISGYINLKNMDDGDEVWIRQYVKLAVDDEYSLYAEEEYQGKQKEPLIHIEKLPAMRGIKVTIQQTKGEPKYFPWEFYGGVAG